MWVRHHFQWDLPMENLMIDKSRRWMQHALNRLCAYKMLLIQIKPTRTDYQYGILQDRMFIIVSIKYITKELWVSYSPLWFSYSFICIGALIVYDITDSDSFDKMTFWVKELRQQRGLDLPIIIVGNKSDLES